MHKNRQYGAALAIVSFLLAGACLVGVIILRVAQRLTTAGDGSHTIKEVLVPFPTPGANGLSTYDQETADLVEHLWPDLSNLPPGSAFTLSTSESELEVVINDAVANSDYESGISDVQVTFEGERILVSGTARVPPFDVTLPGTVVLEPELDADGNLIVNPVSVELGGVEAPAQIEAMLNAAITEAVETHPDILFTGLVLDEDTLQVTGTVLQP